MLIKKVSMRATMADMKTGEVVTIPLKLREYSSIRNCASLLGLSMGRKYSVSLDRVSGECTVTRTA